MGGGGKNTHNLGWNTPCGKLTSRVKRGKDRGQRGNLLEGPGMGESGIFIPQWGEKNELTGKIKRKEEGGGRGKQRVSGWYKRATGFGRESIAKTRGKAGGRANQII